MNLRLPLLINCLLVFVASYSSAQVNLSEIQKEIASDKVIYRYPAFAEGTVVFRNGIISAARLNYNISLDEMHFINQNGDTLALADPPAINFISLNKTRFYYDKGYLQALDTVGEIVLAFKQIFITQRLRPGGYGSTIPYEGARTYNYFNASGQQYNMEDEKHTLTTREYYFFGDKYGNFSKTGKDFILQHFSKHQAGINAFVKDHHINFNKLQDLYLVLRYCSQLPS